VPIDWAVALNKRIATWANGDTGKHAKASVLRPAGTANYKREKPDLVGGYLTGVEAWEPEVMDQPYRPCRSTKRSACGVPTQVRALLSHPTSGACKS